MMMPRDQLSELLKDAERKAWEIIGLLSAADLEAKRQGEAKTLHFITAALAAFTDDTNFIDDGISRAIEAHVQWIGAQRADRHSTE